MCLDDLTFEEGVTCAPRPCPKVSRDLPPDEGCVPGAPDPSARPPAAGRSGSFSRAERREWEDQLRYHLPFDYVPNVFDHEPRPSDLY